MKLSHFLPFQADKLLVIANDADNKLTAVVSH
jgi:hypothetical protein